MTDRLSTNNIPPNAPKPPEHELSAERISQVNNVLRAINEAVEKLKISLVLPFIFENPANLRQYLRGSKFEKCIDLIHEYVVNKKKTKEPHLDYRLIRVIDFFHENVKFFEFLPNLLERLSDDDRDLLNSFGLLHEIAANRLRKSAVEELAKEKKTHEIYHENEQIKESIKEYEVKIRNKKVILRWKLSAKEGLIHKYEEDLAIKKWDNNVRIKQEIMKSSDRIQAVHHASLVKQKELEEELGKTKFSYDKILQQNLKMEKEARDEKNKLLLQLQALIRKYDQTIGDKFKEIIYLEEVYEEKKKEFNEFMVEYNREEAVYKAVIGKKEEEERRMHEEKVMLFMMNRAARIIQRAWRRYRREKRKKSKKSGKGKGKKK